MQFFDKVSFDKVIKKIGCNNICNILFTSLKND